MIAEIVADARFFLSDSKKGTGRRIFTLRPYLGHLACKVDFF